MKRKIIGPVLVTALRAGMAILAGLGAVSCQAGSGPELRVVSQVDLNRYLGRWYEIAAIPAWFEKSCLGGTTATYAQLPHGRIEVLNQCFEAGGKRKQARGVAWVADPATNAKLKVSFIPYLHWNWLAGDYWIIDLGADYEYAVVGNPSRRFGWILSRTPELSEEALKGIQPRLQQQGYDFSRFQMTNQKDFKTGSNSP